ncbi:MAG: TraR/DksA C4-type zinc finger protein [Pseudomonadota bacterium]
MTDLKARKNQLKARLEELQGRLHRIGDHLEQTPNPDWEDRAQESEFDEVLEGLGTSGVREVQAIRAALKRIEAGTYGACVRCSEDILPARLDLLPQTSLCRHCANEVGDTRN